MLSAVRATLAPWTVRTLLEYGGPASLAITVQPLVVSLVLWALLRRRCTRGSRPAPRAVWAIAGAYLAWSVLGALSLAAGAFPAALLLLIAVTLTPGAGSRVSSRQPDDGCISAFMSPFSIHR